MLCDGTPCVISLCFSSFSPLSLSLLISGPVYTTPVSLFWENLLRFGLASPRQQCFWALKKTKCWQWRRLVKTHNFFQSSFILYETSVWALPMSSVAVKWKNLFMIIRYIYISKFVLFLRKTNLWETSAAKACPFPWGNSVRPNHCLLILRNKQLIGFISSRSAIALTIFLFSCSLTCSIGYARNVILRCPY